MNAPIQLSINVNIFVKTLSEVITVNVIEAICCRVITGPVKVCYVDSIQ